MFTPLHYKYHRVELTATPLEAAVRLADHAENTGADAFAVYECDGIWHAGLGRASEVLVTPSTVALYAAGELREQVRSGAHPLAFVEDMLRRTGIVGWRLFGTVAFELSLLGTEAGNDLDPDTVLTHLFVPEVEARFGDGDDWVRALPSVDAEPVIAALVNAGRRARGPVVSDPVDERTDEVYAANVATATERIQAGVLRKVILSRKLEIASDTSVDFNGSFLIGREQNTPARSFRVRLDGLDAAGFSPETVLEVDQHRRVSTQPLAGTRARHGDPTVDAEQVAVLTSDSKEVSEHALSVKAAYADLEAVCTPDSVVVEDFMNPVERGSVVHLASRLSGRLDKRASAWDAFARLFPAVTASGIPRPAACEYIHRVEPYRGLYAGAVLTVAEDGDFDAALVLRSMYRDAERTWLRAGAGIVEPSHPDREFVETCEKLRSLSRAIMTCGEPEHDSSEQRVITDVAEVLGVPVEEVSLDSSGLELGLDSMSLMRLTTQWSRPGSPVRLTDLASANTIRAWADFLPTDRAT